MEKLSRDFFNSMFVQPTLNPNHRGGGGSPKSAKRMRSGKKLAAKARRDRLNAKLLHSLLKSEAHDRREAFAALKAA